MPSLRPTNVLASILALGLLALGATAARADMSSALKGALGGGGSLLGGQSVPALDQVGIGNLTGVLTYCMKNDLLGGGAAGVKDQLLGKLGGERKAKSDAGYREGLGGVLGGDSDQKLDLSGGGLKQQLTDKVCEEVLKYGKSLI